jgi:hypothetical protein
MSISPRPKKIPGAVGSTATANDADVMRVIAGGGSAPRATEIPGRQMQHPLKFADAQLFERLERARAALPVKLPRNTWILQAIAEKLERDGF